MTFLRAVLREAGHGLRLWFGFRCGLLFGELPVDLIQHWRGEFERQFRERVADYVKLRFVQNQSVSLFHCEPLRDCVPSAG